MVTIRDRNMPGGWRVALVEDNRRNRYIEIFDLAITSDRR
jgi:hypothetical protein